MDRRVEKLLASNELRRPTLCQKCEGVLVYRGIGEYICEECGAVETAVARVLEEGYRTADIFSAGMKKVGCRKMAELIAERI